MILHPEVQQKAQLEIDKVVGRGRLPDFGDRATLPYIQAIVHEVLRYACRDPVTSSCNFA